MQKEPPGGFSGVQVRGSLDEGSGSGDGEKRLGVRDLLMAE